MKETGILMRPPMVRALVASDKWETRRPLKKQPPVRDGHAADPFNWSRVERVGPWFHIMADNPHGQFTVQSPYGLEGDLLYVRESIRRATPEAWASVYVADGAPTVGSSWPWKRDVLPSMHMPRRFSRMEMVLTGVRLERLWAIDDVGALREGFCRTPTLAIQRFGELIRPRLGTWETAPPRDNYLWFLDTIHGAGFSARNEWVWVLQWEAVNLTYIQDPGAI